MRARDEIRRWLPLFAVSISCGVGGCEWAGGIEERTAPSSVSDSGTGGGPALDAGADGDFDSGLGEGGDSYIPADLEINGTWRYSGAYPGYSSELLINNTSVSEIGSFQGTSFDTQFQVLDYDNAADQVSLRATRIIGPASVSEGAVVYYKYSVSGRSARFRYAAAGYPLSADGQEGDDTWTYERQ